jgi:hypothetical protein
MRTPKSAAMFAKVDEWKNSGLTLREFASSIGLSKSAFEDRPLFSLCTRVKDKSLAKKKPHLADARFSSKFCYKGTCG